MKKITLMLHGPVLSSGRDHFTHSEFFAKRISSLDLNVNFDCSRNIKWYISESKRLGLDLIYVGWGGDQPALAAIFGCETTTSSLVIINPDSSYVSSGPFGFQDNSSLFHQAVLAGLKSVNPKSTVIRCRSDVFFSLSKLLVDLEKYKLAGIDKFLMLADFYRPDPACIGDMVMVSCAESLRLLHDDLNKRVVSGNRYSNSIHSEFHQAIRNLPSEFKYICSMSKKTVDSMLWRGCPHYLRDGHDTNFIYDGIIAISP